MLFRSGTIVPEWGLFVNSGHYEIMIIMEMIIGTIKKSPHSGTIVPEWGLFFLKISKLWNKNLKVKKKEQIRVPGRRSVDRSTKATLILTRPGNN